MFLEVILMTYSYVHRAINSEAFPNAPDLYDSGMMTGDGEGTATGRNPGQRPRCICGRRSGVYWEMSLYSI